MSFWTFAKRLNKIEELAHTAETDDDAADVPVGSAAYNADARAMAAAFGDDGTAPRRVLHILAPLAPDAADKEPIRALLRPLDGTFEDHDEMDNILFVQHREVASAAFDAMTDDLRHALAAKGWDYYGIEIGILSEGG